MNSEEHQFFRNFSVKRISKSYSSARSQYDSFNTFNTYGNKSYNYYGNDDEVLEVEMTRRGWDELMRFYRVSEKMAELENYEHNMRQKHLAVKDMYEKYRMLLELYR
jgi:hypothetical protein